jgi:anti-sigma B factor antagonist
MAIHELAGEMGGAVLFRAELMKGEDPAVVKLTGELDLLAAPQLEVCLVALRAEGAHDIRLDLSGLSFCDSSGISALLKASKQCRKSGGHLSIASPQAAVRRVLEITGLLDYFSEAKPEDDGGGGKP